MAQPYLIFQQYSQFFTLDITNIQELSVAQIQSLETFTRVRNGLFDFKRAQIKIMKRIEIQHLVQLFTLTDLNPYIREKEEVISLESQKAESPPIAIGFGKHRGTLYSELPGEYLQWLKRNYRGSERDLIESEIKRRGL